MGWEWSGPGETADKIRYWQAWPVGRGAHAASRQVKEVSSGRFQVFVLRDGRWETDPGLVVDTLARAKNLAERVF